MRKRLFVLTLMTVLCMSVLGGCKKQSYKDPVPKDTVVVVTQTKDAEESKASETEGTEAQEESVEMANPFTDHATLQEAVEASGINLVLPVSVKNYVEQTYSNVGTTFIEVIYRVEDQPVEGEGQNQLIIRKEPTATPTDISGDYTAYKLETVMELSGTNVTLRCEEGKAYVALWYYEDASYSVVCHYGIETQDMQDLVSEIIECNR